jgi:phosphocarrier protein
VYQSDLLSTKRKEFMSRTIEVIMRHMTPPPIRATEPGNGVKKLEKEITVKKQRHIWAEARFVRAMLPFHSNVRVGYNGKEVDGKSTLELMTLAPPEGATVRICAEGPDAAAAMHAVAQVVQADSDEN